MLRGPLFGFSDRELFAFKQAGGWFSLFTDRTLSDPQSRRRFTALRWLTLREYYRWTRVLPPAAALERMLEDTGYLALAATTPGGVEAGDLLHAVDRVRQVVEEGGSLADAAECARGRLRGIERSRVAAARARPHRRRPADEPAQGQGARGRRRVPGRSVRRLYAAGRTCTSCATEPKAQGWFQLVRKTEGLVRSNAARRARRLGRARGGGAAVSRGRRGPAALCRRHARARAARRQPLRRQADRNPAWGVLNNFLADAKELAVPRGACPPHVAPLGLLDCGAGRGDVTRGAPRTSASPQPSWSITSVTAEARHIARMTRAADARPTIRRGSSAPTRPRIAPTPAWRGAR